LSAIKEHLLIYAALLLRGQAGLLAGVLTLVLVGGIETRAAIMKMWPLFAICLAAMGLYSLVHTEPRFVGAYLVVFWMAILAGVRLPSRDMRKMAVYMAWAIVITVLLSVADGTARAVIAGGPYSARDQIVVADNLQRMGLRHGDQVAVLGDGNWSYWARLGKFKIVSTIMSPDIPTFWDEDAQHREDIYRLFATTGARAIVTNKPPNTSSGEGWQQIGTSAYYVRWLSR
jgi:hypothetical protein